MMKNIRMILSWTQLWILSSLKLLQKSQRSVRLVNAWAYACHRYSTWDITGTHRIHLHVQCLNCSRAYMQCHNNIMHIHTHAHTHSRTHPYTHQDMLEMDLTIEHGESNPDSEEQHSTNVCSIFSSKAN